jgi:hypothetical protein
VLWEISGWSVREHGVWSSRVIHERYAGTFIVIQTSHVLGGFHGDPGEEGCIRVSDKESVVCFLP